MNGLSEVEREVVANFRDFADNEVTPGALERDATCAFSYDLVPRLAAIGLFGMIFPEEHGGQGAQTTPFVLALEQITRADQSVAALVAKQVGLSALSESWDQSPRIPFDLGSHPLRIRWRPVLCASRWESRGTPHERIQMKGPAWC